MGRDPEGPIHVRSKHRAMFPMRWFAPLHWGPSGRFSRRLLWSDCPVWHLFRLPPEERAAPCSPRPDIGLEEPSNRTTVPLTPLGHRAADARRALQLCTSPDAASAEPHQPPSGLDLESQERRDAFHSYETMTSLPHLTNWKLGDLRTAPSTCQTDAPQERRIV